MDVLLNFLKLSIARPQKAGVSIMIFESTMRGFSQ